MIAGMRCGSATDGSAWKRRIEEFEREQRRPLGRALAFAGLYLLFFYVVLSCADMDGHDRFEEPLRSFVYSSLRAFLCFFLEPARRLPRPTGDVVAYSAFVGCALGFGFVASWLLRSFRRTKRTG
jgi:hypothetical protein